MSTAPKTTFAPGRQAPWPVVSGGKKSGGKSPPVDVSTLKIVRDPLPAGRSPAPHKYGALFAKMEFGDAVKCQPFETGKVAKALGNWLKLNKKDGIVRSCRNYPDDGMGRVWLLEPEKKAGRKGGAA